MLTLKPMLVSDGSISMQGWEAMEAEGVEQGWKYQCSPIRTDCCIFASLA